MRENKSQKQTADKKSSLSNGTKGVIFLSNVIDFGEFVL